MYENKSHRNKKIALAAALAVAILALAGVGYAHTYNGTTTSSSQTVDVDYVAIKIAGDSAYGYTDAKTIHTSYDTVSTSTTVTYTYNSAQSDEVIVYKLLISTPTNAGGETDTFTISADYKSGDSAPSGYTPSYYFGTSAPTTTFGYDLGDDFDVDVTIGSDTTIYFAVKIVPTNTDPIVVPSGTAPSGTATLGAFVFTVVGTQTHA